jgi:hypothetical protein
MRRASLFGFPRVQRGADVRLALPAARSRILAVAALVLAVV